MNKINLLNNEGRIYWIDWAKAIGIWLVILGHTPSRGHIFIYMFHMPFFFMLSGFLYKKSGFAIEIMKTFKTLILLYITYNALLIVGAIICGEFKIGILYFTR